MVLAKMKGCADPMIKQYFPDNMWRIVWFHMGQLEVCGVFECMRSHRWKSVLYVWQRWVVARFGSYYETVDNRPMFRCPFCDADTDRFIPNFTFAVTLTLPPRQLGPWNGVRYDVAFWPFDRPLFPWDWRMLDRHEL